MARLPLTVRALVLLPLLAVAADVTRAAVACGPRAETCLEVAGSGRFGPAGAAVLIGYALLLAVGVARLARGSSSMARLWLVATAGVAAACAGHLLLAGTFGDAAALGGGWATLPLLCAGAGALIALALRVAPAAVAALRRLRPSAPRVRAGVLLLLQAPAAPVRRIQAPLALAAAGRAPPPVAR